MAKAYIMVYATECDGDVIVSTMTKDQICRTIERLHLSDEDYAIIDGTIVKPINRKWNDKKWLNY